MLLVFCFPILQRTWLPPVRNKRPWRNAKAVITGVQEIQLSPGLGRLQERMPFTLADTETEDEVLPLAYILIDEGRSGALRRKLMIRWSTADTVMHEALNGTSIVFSAVVLKSNVAKLLDSTGFKRVETVKQLQELDLSQAGKEEAIIGLLC
ncbi:hypothetical protein VTN96DRAFT_6837 [Rasamsonia emersonii]